MVFASVSLAETITILNNGKPGGSFNARSQLYKEGLEARGYVVNYESIGKIGQAIKIFRETIEPTIMVYSTNQVYKQNLFHDINNFIILEYEQPMWICRTFHSVDKQGSITVAHGKGYDTNIIKQALGNNIVLVPYKNSGSILKGILAKDVDAAVNNQGKSLKYVNSGQGTCKPSDILPVMQATVIGKNINVDQLREVILSITNDDKFVQYHRVRQLKKPESNNLEVIKNNELTWEVN